MLHIGNTNTLTIARAVRFGMYLASDGEEILLPRKHVPDGVAVGDTVDVFVYTDSEDRVVATTRRPLAEVGEFAALRVRDAIRIGAFLDWGLDKDLFVPCQLQRTPMRRGEVHVVYVCLDEVSRRVMGSAKLTRFLSEDTAELTQGQKVELLIHERSDIGLGAVVDGKYAGLLFHNEVFERLEVGNRRQGYVKRIREDGKIDLSLQPQGYVALMQTQSDVLEALTAAGGFLPLTAKSDPNAVYSQLGISKRAFKKLIGDLYKKRRITISDDGIRLVE